MANESVRDIAETANILAQQASARSAASGVILDALIGALLEGGVLQKGELEQVFRESYAYVNGQAPPAGGGEPLRKEAILKILRRVAAGHGVSLEASA